MNKLSYTSVSTIQDSAQRRGIGYVTCRACNKEIEADSSIQAKVPDKMSKSFGEVSIFCRHCAAKYHLVDIISGQAPTKKRKDLTKKRILELYGGKIG